MACGLSKSLGSLSSSLKKQGIMTILGGECDSDVSSNTSASSLRRTFSADMSSKNWLSRDGFCPMKTISSSEELNVFVTDSQSSDEDENGKEGGGGEESRSGFDIWAQIQEEKKNRKIDEQKPDQSGAWSSILSQKSEPIKMVPPPYVHPIVKRSSSSLSEKSLEICTESLGSETGSDGFSWFPSPEKKDSQDEKVKKQEQHQKVMVEAKEEDHSEGEEETSWVSDCNRNTTSREESSRGGSIPPTIPSLLSQSGKSLHMKTSRNNGRLVLEAVSTPSQNNFSAKRQNGRLVLTFADPKEETHDANDIEEEEEEEERNSEVLWSNEEDEEEEETANGLAGVHNSAQKLNGLLSVHRLAHKAIGIPKRNPRWPGKDNEPEPAGKPEAAQSLPPRPRVAQLARAAQPPSTVDDTVEAACFNAYDYYWRSTKPITDTKPSSPSPNTMAQLQAQDSLKKNHGWLNGCKEQKRSLLFFEQFCIATS